MAALKRFVPMFDRILVERLAPETKTKGGILIPEKAQNKAQEGVVRAAGPGAVRQDGTREPIGVQAGDRVLLPEYGGTKVVLDDQDYFLFREGDLLGKFTSS